MKPLRFLFSLCAALLLTTAAAQNLAPVPSMSSPVVDLIGLLPSAQSDILRQKLWEREVKTGNQVVILIVPSTQSENIFDYSWRVFDKWRVGRFGVDDGVLWIISADNGYMRLNTGYGVEGVLPDLICKRILETEVFPRFRQRDYFGGLDAGITAIHAALDKGKFPPPGQEPSQKNERALIRPLLWIVLPTVIVFAGFGYGFFYLKRRRNKHSEN